MALEIQMRAWSVLLGVLQILIAAALMTRQRGLHHRTGRPALVVGAGGLLAAVPGRGAVSALAGVGVTVLGLWGVL